MADDAAGKAEETAQQVADKAKPMADDVSDQIEGGADKVADQAQSTAEDASNKLQVPKLGTYPAVMHLCPSATAFCLCAAPCRALHVGCAGVSCIARPGLWSLCRCSGETLAILDTRVNVHVQDKAKDVKEQAGPTARKAADKAKAGGKQAADKAKDTAGQARDSAHDTLKGGARPAAS